MRLILRLAGYALLAFGFVVALIDGLRMIAGGPVDFLALRRVWALANGRGLAALEDMSRSIEGLWPMLLNPMLEAPAALYGILPGLLLIWLGRRREPDIGIISRR